MWDGFFMLLSLSTVMAIASFLAGSLPLTLTLSQQKLRLLSAIGTGVLVGTSLIVIIPEGIETLYSAAAVSHVEPAKPAHPARGASVPVALHGHPEHEARFAELWNRQDSEALDGLKRRDEGIIATLSRVLNTDPAGWSRKEKQKKRDVMTIASAIEAGEFGEEPSKWFKSLSKRDQMSISSAIEAGAFGEDPTEWFNTPEKRERVRRDQPSVASYIVAGEFGEDPSSWAWHRKRAEDDHEHEHEHSGPNPHAWVGLSLIAGYILMYLIDVIPTLTAPASRPRAMHISLSNLSQGLHHDPSSSPNQSPPDSPYSRAVSDGDSRQSSATTIGLVIHAIADGIALGASTASATARSSLGLVVFLAIMLHKAPAAFGLTTVLLKQGLTKRQARGHLLVFSLAAPIGAFATWAFVNMLGRGGEAEGQSELWWTGVVLIFSGGTFLYVAMHSMQDSRSHSHVAPSEIGNGYLDSEPYLRSQPKDSKGMETAAAVIGMLLPLLTQVGHAHAH